MMMTGLQAGHSLRKIARGLGREHQHRYKYGRNSKSDRVKIADMVSIHDRPEEIEGRQISGHWEGDIFIGKNHGFAVGTLVERKSRYTFLAHLESQEAEDTRLSFTRKLKDVPEELIPISIH